MKQLIMNITLAGIVGMGSSLLLLETSIDGLAALCIGGGIIFIGGIYALGNYEDQKGGN